MPATQRLTISDENGVRLVRFLDRRLFDDVVVRDVGDQLQALLPRSGPISLVIDFSGVESVSSSMLGKLLLLQRRVDNAGGQLRLCELSSVVRAVFSTTNLDRLFAIDRDRQEALQALQAT